MAHTEDLITLLAVAGRPVRVIEAAAALGIEPEEVMSAAEELTEAGQAVDTAEGITVSETTPQPKSASRATFLAGRWADALAKLGGDPTEIGLALLAAGQYEKAAERLVPVALGDGTAAAVDGALAAGEHGSFFSAVTEGQLHLLRAAHRRDAGDTNGAADDLDMAIRRLEGAPLVDALGLAASVASDLQRSQKAVALAVLGAWQAVQIGDFAKQGSLLTLHGRELSRIGFPAESDRAIEVGRQLVDEHGTPDQKDRAHDFAAWVMFDRGEVRNAEAEFATLTDHARGGDEVVLGNREGYWARALFASGQAREALEAATRAEQIADRSGADAPRFLAGLARMEGAYFFGRFHDSVAAAESVLEIIRRSLPQWENVALVGMARAYAAAGEPEKAREAVDAALASTPEGIDGWRWRIHAREVELTLLPETSSWPQKDAEDLTDALLQARWFSSAAHLMSVRAHREKDRALGLEAAALALQIGNPMLAATAVSAAGAWDDPAVVPVARVIQHLEPHVPEEWLEEWRALPWVADAFEVDTDVEVDTDELTEHIDEALRAAGLAGTDIILSPAQRQAKGLVRRRPRRRLSTATLVAAAIGVVLVSGATAWAVGNVFGPQEEPGASATTAPTTTTIPTMEQTQVALPELGIFGSSPIRGGDSRSGVFEESGFRQVMGHYWTDSPGGFFSTNPVSYGYRVYVGSSTETSLLVYAQGELEKINLGSSVTSDVAVQQVDTPFSGSTTYLVFGTEDGLVRAHNALQYRQMWTAEVGGVVRTAPLIVSTPHGPTVIVAADTGAIVALNAETGEERWRYEGSEEGPLGRVLASPAYHEGIVYVVDEDGVLHLIGIPDPEPVVDEPTDSAPVINDPSGGDTGSADGQDAPDVGLEPEAICQHRYPGPLPVGSNPVISRGVVYIPTADWGIWMTEVGNCNRQPQDRVTPAIETTNERGIQFAPIVENNIIYVVDNARIVAIDAVAVPERRFDYWDAPFNAESIITGAPIMSEGIIYVGTQDGRVIAIDAETGSQLWEFRTGAAISGSVAVVKSGAIFVTTSEGEFIAIAAQE